MSTFGCSQWVSSIHIILLKYRIPETYMDYVLICIEKVSVIGLVFFSNAGSILNPVVGLRQVTFNRLSEA